MSQAPQFKKKQRVHFNARVTSGTGTITSVIESARGLWYEVKADASGKLFKLRAAHLSAAE